jgi:hypothetical protein
MSTNEAFRFRCGGWLQSREGVSPTEPNRGDELGQAIVRAAKFAKYWSKGR